MSAQLAWPFMAFLVIAMMLLERRPATPRVVYGVVKLIAASTFVVYGAARIGPATIATTAAGGALFAALLFSWVGDALLIPRGKKGFFLGGLAAFLVAHLAYVPAFARRGIDGRAMVASAAVAVVAAAVVLRWLRPHVRGTMWRAVVAYVVVICVMLCTSIGAVAHAAATGVRAPSAILVVGTFLFWLSDLTIARERFVAPGYANRAVGIPLYFFAQLLIVAGWCGAAASTSGP
jgi:uncharacterized membrane protein YhhN